MSMLHVYYLLTWFMGFQHSIDQACKLCTTDLLQSCFDECFWQAMCGALYRFEDQIREQWFESSFKKWFLQTCILEANSLIPFLREVIHSWFKAIILKVGTRLQRYDWTRTTSSHPFAKKSGFNFFTNLLAFAVSQTRQHNLSWNKLNKQQY